MGPIRSAKNSEKQKDLYGAHKERKKLKNKKTICGT